MLLKLAPPSPLTDRAAQQVPNIGGTPIADRAFQPNLTFTGRLKDPSQFEDIVVKAGQDGRIVRLRDIARIELGALDYSTNSFLLRKTAVAMLVTQRPGSNALATAKGHLVHHSQAEGELPEGARLQYRISAITRPNSSPSRSMN